MKTRNSTKNYRKQKKEAFSITQKGFTFTMESCGKNRSRRLTSDNQYECSGYLVNGYPKIHMSQTQPSTLFVRLFPTKLGVLYKTKYTVPAG